MWDEMVLLTALIADESFPDVEEMVICWSGYSLMACICAALGGGQIGSEKSDFPMPLLFISKHTFIAPGVRPTSKGRSTIDYPTSDPSGLVWVLLFGQQQQNI